MRAAAAQRPPRPDAAVGDRRMHEPQHRPEPGQRQAGGVDAAHGYDGEGEQGRVAPAAGAGGPHSEPDEPAQPGPGQQNGRDTGRVVERVGAQFVGEHGDQQAPAVEVEGAQQVADAEAGREQQRADPQALGHPVGGAHRLEEPVEGAHRPEEADVLMGDRPQGPVGIPQHAGLAHEPARVEIEVGLGVRPHQSGAGGQQRPVGDRGGHRHRPAGPVAPPGCEPGPDGGG